MKTILKMIAIASLSQLLAACANHQSGRDVNQILLEKGLEVGDPVQRISSHRINGWQAVDSRHLILNAGVSDALLISLQSPCVNLDSAFSIGFSSHLSSVDRFQHIVVRGIGHYREVCDIKAVYSLHSALSSL